MTVVEKDRLSHRGGALQQFTRFMKMVLPSIVVGCSILVTGCGTTSVSTKKNEVIQSVSPVSHSRSTIAVMEFQSHNKVSQPIGAIVGNIVRDQLIESDLFIVLEQQAVEMVLREQAFQKSGCTTADCITVRVERV